MHARLVVVLHLLFEKQVAQGRTWHRVKCKHRQVHDQPEVAGGCEVIQSKAAPLPRQHAAAAVLRLFQRGLPDLQADTKQRLLSASDISMKLKVTHSTDRPAAVL